MELLDVGHYYPDTLNLRPRRKQDRRAFGGQQVAVERRRLDRYQLGMEAREVPDVLLVLPDKRRVEAGGLQLRLRPFDAQLPELIGVGAVLVLDAELTVRKRGKVGMRRPSRAHLGRDLSTARPSFPGSCPAR